MKEELSNIDLKEIQLGILEYLDRFCKKNGIKYYLFYGSLLGAVRHQGYIPWDDDIDVAMFREDYERFFLEFNREENKQYKAISEETDPRYYLAMGKVIDLRTVLIEEVRGGEKLGVYVDIFPIDYLPNDIVTRNKVIKKLFIMKKLLLYKQAVWTKERSVVKNIVYLIIQFLSLPISSNCLCKKINFCASQSNDNKEVSELCGDLVSDIHTDKYIWPMKYFEKITYVEFENIHSPAPLEYDEVLRISYGNYLKLPPEEERKSHHHSHAFWRNL